MCARNGNTSSLLVSGFPYALAFHTELELFAQAGLTPFEVLQTATMRAAEALGEGSNPGSIEAGKLADLVIVTT